MAKATVELATELANRLSRISQKTPEIIENVLRAGGQILKDETDRQYRRKIGAGTKYASRSTGRLLSALGMTPVKQNRAGDLNLHVGFRENRTDGRRNALIAGVFEHGRPGKSSAAKSRANRRPANREHNRPAQNVMRTAQMRVRGQAEQAMEREFDRQVNNMGGTT